MFLELFTKSLTFLQGIHGCTHLGLLNAVGIKWKVINVQQLKQLIFIILLKGLNPAWI